MKNALINDYIHYKLKAKDFKVTKCEIDLVGSYFVCYESDDKLHGIGISSLDLMTFIYEHSQKLFFDEKSISAIGSTL